MQILNAGSLFGAVIGALPAVWMTRPARFDIRGAAAPRLLPAIEGRLLKRGYVLAASADGVHHYRGKLPRFLRWDEQDLRLVVDARGIRVEGPYAVLRGLRRRLVTGTV